MKKRIATAAAFAACLALCAAVWPQAEPVEKTPAAPTPTAVTATKPEVPKIPEIERIIMSEEEKTDLTEPVHIEEVIAAAGPTPVPTPTVDTLPDTTEQKLLPQSEIEPTFPSPDNMVYVPGFGWLENQGPNHCEYAEDMYENGNKIGIMG